MGATPLLVLLGSVAVAFSLQSTSNRVAFFFAGLLMALVPLLVLGTLGAVLIRLYLRSRASAREAGAEDEEAGGT